MAALVCPSLGGLKNRCSLNERGASGGVFWPLGEDEPDCILRTLEGEDVEPAGLLHFVPEQVAKVLTVRDPPPKPCLEEDRRSTPIVDHQVSIFRRYHTRAYVPGKLLSGLFRSGMKEHCPSFPGNLLAAGSVGQLAAPVVFFPTGVGGGLVGCRSLWGGSQVVRRRRKRRPLRKLAPEAESTPQAIRQLAVSYHEGGQLVVSRSMYIAAFHKASTEGPESCSAQLLGSVTFASRLADLAWSPWLKSEAAVVTSVGEVYLLKVLEGGTSPSGAQAESQGKVARRLVREAVGGSAVGWKVVWGDHPRRLLLAQKDRISVLDLRSGEAVERTLIGPDAFQWRKGVGKRKKGQKPVVRRTERFCALARPADVAGEAASWFAVATNLRLLLYDSRAPSFPLIQWDHLMEAHPPEQLFFTPPLSTPSELSSRLIIAVRRQGQHTCFCFPFAPLPTAASYNTLGVTPLCPVDTPYRVGPLGLRPPRRRPLVGNKQLASSVAKPLAGLVPLVHMRAGPATSPEAGGEQLVTALSLLQLSEEGRLTVSNYAAVAGEEKETRKAQAHSNEDCSTQLDENKSSRLRGRVAKAPRSERARARSPATRGSLSKAALWRRRQKCKSKPALPEVLPCLAGYVQTGLWGVEGEDTAGEGGFDGPGSLQGRALELGVQLLGQKLPHPVTEHEAAEYLLAEALPGGLRGLVEAALPLTRARKLPLIKRKYDRKRQLPELRKIYTGRQPLRDSVLYLPLVAVLASLQHISRQPEMTAYAAALFYPNLLGELAARIGDCFERLKAEGKDSRAVLQGLSMLGLEESGASDVREMAEGVGLEEIDNGGEETPEEAEGCPLEKHASRVMLQMNDKFCLDTAVVPMKAGRREVPPEASRRIARFQSMWEIAQCDFDDSLQQGKTAPGGVRPGCLPLKKEEPALGRVFHKQSRIDAQSPSSFSQPYGSLHTSSQRGAFGVAQRESPGDVKLEKSIRLGGF